MKIQGKVVKCLSLLISIIIFCSLSVKSQDPQPRNEVAQNTQKVEVAPKVAIPSADTLPIQEAQAPPAPLPAQAVPPPPQATPAPQAAPPPNIPPQGVAPQAGANLPSGVPTPPPNLQFRKNLPPAIFVRGKEGNINRVFIEPATVNKEIKVELIMFDIDPNEKLNPPKPYGIPASATFKVESNQVEKNKAVATFTWTPTEKDVGLHAFAFEITNSKNEPNRVALFFDVK